MRVRIIASLLGPLRTQPTLEGGKQGLTHHLVEVKVRVRVRVRVRVKVRAGSGLDLYTLRSMYGRYGTPEAGFTYPIPHVPTVHTVRGEGRQGTLPCASGTYSAQVVDIRVARTYSPEAPGRLRISLAHHVVMRRQHPVSNVPLAKPLRMLW